MMADKYSEIDNYENHFLKPYLLALNNSSTLPHYNSSLLSHLCGTWRILQSSSYSNFVCLAGLFHSVYATEFYPHGLYNIKERHKVIEAIGQDAEFLVFLFCTLKKQKIWSQLKADNDQISVSSITGETYFIPKEKAKELFYIESANFIEQCSENDSSPRPFMSWYLEKYKSGFIRLHTYLEKFFDSLSEENEHLSIIDYNQYIIHGTPDYLYRAFSSNPLSAEINLFLCLIEIENKCYDLAKEKLEIAQQLLTAWGTQWDKRLTFSEWQNFIDFVRFNWSQLDSMQTFTMIRSSIIKP